MKQITIFLLFISILASCGKSNQSGSNTHITREGVTEKVSQIQLDLNDVGLEFFFDKYESRRGLVSGVHCYPVKITNSEVIRQLNILLENIKGSEYLELSGFPRSSKEIQFLITKSISFFKQISQDFKCPFKTLYI